MSTETKVLVGLIVVLAVLFMISWANDTGGIVAVIREMFGG